MTEVLTHLRFSAPRDPAVRAALKAYDLANAKLDGKHRAFRLMEALAEEIIALASAGLSDPSRIAETALRRIGVSCAET